MISSSFIDHCVINRIHTDLFTLFHTRRMHFVQIKASLQLQDRDRAFQCNRCTPPTEERMNPLRSTVHVCTCVKDHYSGCLHYVRDYIVAVCTERLILTWCFQLHLNLRRPIIWQNGRRRAKILTVHLS